MPYTPPSQHSPAVSVANTPTLTRRSSYQPGQAPRLAAATNRPDLPRSASYLTRQHRRTPSIRTAAAEAPCPPPTADNDSVKPRTASSSLRQSPHPKTGGSHIPAGAVISPPDSARDSGEDEDSSIRGLKLENLAELQEAIRILAENEGNSLGQASEEIGKAEKAIASALQADDQPLTQRFEDVKAALSHDVRRKISHHRSHTETIYLDLRKSPEISATPSEDESVSEEDGVARTRPPMLRKKSGELVRPALRPSSARRRPSSMPGTPTFGKAVHFDSHLEHVRHFLQVDRPLAVSARSSPVETYEGETEFPFSEETRSPPYEWEVVLVNFPAAVDRVRLQPVQVERVYLSADNKNLIGSVAVANIAFNKLVVARFTLDYWKTTSEVVAEYNSDVRQPKMMDGYDRFNFSIKLADLANLEAKTMFFCVKYVVNGQENWDNNASTNYQVDFRKNARPRHGKKGMQSAASRPTGTLPRSHRQSPAPRPQSMPVAFDDFAGGFDFKDFKPVDELIRDSGPALRLKGVKSAVNIPSSETPQPPGQAFGNRYDFGASLSAAISAANSTLGERSGIVMKPKPSPMRHPAKYLPDAEDTASSHSTGSTTGFSNNPIPRSVMPSSNSSDVPRPIGSEKPALASQSYNELLDKYCFYGTGKGSPQLKDGTLKSGQLDGSSDSYVLGSVNSSSNTNSPITMKVPQRPKFSAQPIDRSSPPQTTFGSGTSAMYPYHRSENPWNNAHSATAIHG